MRRFIAKFTLVTLLATQVMAIGLGLMIPKPAAATYPTVTMANVYDVLKDIAMGVAKTFALKFVNQYLTKFVNKVVEKYKIRNFLYYDQILTNYYLTNFIKDKIRDPDLQQIYTLLNAAFVTGQPTGLSGQPPSNIALIPQIKTAIYKRYLDVTGLEPTKIANNTNLTGSEKFWAARMSLYESPELAERTLSGEYVGFQSASSTAAQLEIIVGDSLKAGRLLGSTCAAVPLASKGINFGSGTGGLPNNLPPATDPNTSQQACESAGGTWQASTFDQARSFIDNPTAFLEPHIENTVEAIFGANYDPESIWTQVGSALGSFLYNRLMLDNPSGAPLNEDPGRPYQATSGTPNNGTVLDIDGDGIADGYDLNGDGQADICIYGGTTTPAGPPCQGSSAASTAPAGTGTLPGGILPGPGGTCTPPAMATSVPPGSNSYQGSIQVALNTALQNDPGSAGTANNSPNLQAAADALMSATVDILISQGFRAGFARDCAGAPDGNSIVVWQAGDQMAQYVDVFIGFGAGNSTTLSQMASPGVIFNTDIPRSCIATPNPSSC